jgi:hypothetical protein
MRRILRALALAVALAMGGCGFGFYADDGHPVPEPGWWPFVCDGGSPPTSDAGCDVPACPDGGCG